MPRPTRPQLTATLQQLIDRANTCGPELLPYFRYMGRNFQYARLALTRIEQIDPDANDEAALLPLSRPIYQNLAVFADAIAAPSCDVPDTPAVIAESGIHSTFGSTYPVTVLTAGLIDGLPYEEGPANIPVVDGDNVFADQNLTVIKFTYELVGGAPPVYRENEATAIHQRIIRTDVGGNVMFNITLIPGTATVANADSLADYAGTNIDAAIPDPLLVIFNVNQAISRLVAFLNRNGAQGVRACTARLQLITGTYGVEPNPDYTVIDGTTGDFVDIAINIDDLSGAPTIYTATDNVESVVLTESDDNSSVGLPLDGSTEPTTFTIIPHASTGTIRVHGSVAFTNDGTESVELSLGLSQLGSGFFADIVSLASDNYSTGAGTIFFDTTFTTPAVGISGGFDASVSLVIQPVFDIADATKQVTIGERQITIEQSA